MVDLLEYLVLEDLSRGWRITQPNLEQTGLLRIEYPGLAELASEDGRWQDLPAIAEADPNRRQDVLKAFLDHLRMNLIIDANPLTQEAQRSLTHRADQWLKDPWRLEENDILARQGLALLPGKRRTRYEGNGRATMSLGARSAIFRYLRSQHTWDTDHNFSVEECESLVAGIINQLRGQYLSIATNNKSEERGVRLLAAGMQWVAATTRPCVPTGAEPFPTPAAGGPKRPASQQLLHEPLRPRFAPVARNAGCTAFWSGQRCRPRSTRAAV